MNSELVVLILSLIVPIGSLIYMVIYTRRKDSAQTDEVKQTIRKMSDETNASRDLRIWDLEKWSDLMRPWARAVLARVDTLCDLLDAELNAQGKQLPPMDPLPPMPEPPPPRIPT